MQQAPISPVIKYPGSKFQIADWIIGCFPEHVHYVETHFGGGSVFFNKQPARHEVINDLSGDVCNLFRVIRNDGDRLAALIEMTPWAREEYELSYEPCDDPMERARRFLVMVCQSHGSGSLVRKNGWRNAITPTRSLASNWAKFPSRILSAVARLKNASIENSDAVSIIERYCLPETLIYADPPYPLSTRSQRLYQCEMTDADHTVLLDALDAHPGPVVLSGYHCPLYDDRLSRWHVREKRTRTEKGNHQIECLWLNQVCIDRLGYGPMFE